MIVRNIITFHVSKAQTSDKKEIFERQMKAIGTKYILVLLYIFTSFGYFNKHYEEIYECGKMLTFEDMSPGITFIIL